MGNRPEGRDWLEGQEIDLWLVVEGRKILRRKEREEDARNFLTGYGSRAAAVIRVRTKVDLVYTPVKSPND